MFNLNPLNLPNAPVQHLIMLMVAAVLGFLIAYVSRRQAAGQLESDLTSTNRDLADSHRAPPVPVVSVVGQNPEETVTLNRIAARAHTLNVDRIGYASVHEADDLKIIDGIGPFLEKKLHATGIYTFRQIASFTADDIEQVNDVIEFFPGRIERENWVGQAAELVKNKQS